MILFFLRFISGGVWNNTRAPFFRVRPGLGFVQPGPHLAVLRSQSPPAASGRRAHLADAQRTLAPSSTQHNNHHHGDDDGGNRASSFCCRQHGTVRDSWRQHNGGEHGVEEEAVVGPRDLWRGRAAAEETLKRVDCCIFIC